MYFFYISPSIVEVQTLGAKVTEYNNVLAKSKELANQRDTVLTAYNSISETDVERLNKVIPDTFDAVVFANDINSIASRYGVSLKDFKVNEPTAQVRDQIINTQTNQLYKTVAVTLTVVGPYDGFVSFLKNVESSLRLVDVGSLSVKSATGPRATNGSLEYSLEVYTYSLR